MLNDYEERFYRKLHERHERMVAEDFRMAREIAAWKRRVSSAWDKVHVVNTEQFNMDKEAILIGHGYDVEVVVDIDGLRPEDIGVEMILADQITDNKNVRVIAKRELTFVRQDGSRAFYSVRSTPESTGSFDMAIRVFPKNDKLPHRMDFALVKWA
jgi:alpha-glucan phosphorylase